MEAIIATSLEHVSIRDNKSVIECMRWQLSFVLTSETAKWRPDVPGQ